MQNLISYFNTLHSHIMDPDRIPIAITAITAAAILGIITGPLAGNATPFFWILVDKSLGGFGDRLDRVHRPTRDLALRGLGLTVFALVLALAVGKLFARLVLEKPLYGTTEILLLCLLITVGAPWFSLLRLYFAIDKRQTLQGAYLAISHSTRINLNATDEYGITRAGMGFAARIFDKGLVSPVFWYLVGGLPLAVIYSTLAALSWRFGKNGFSKGFGSVPLALEMLMGYVPSLFAAFILTAATIVTPTAAIHKGVASWFRHKNRAPYEQGGYPLTALAWSLNVTLGGAAQDLSGSAQQNVWVGPEGATARHDHKHLRRAIYIHFAGTILFMATLCGSYLWSGL